MNLGKIATGTILDVAFDKLEETLENKIRRMLEGVFVNDRTLWGYIRIPTCKLEGCKYSIGSVVYVSCSKDGHLYNFKADIEGFKENEKQETIIKVRLQANVFEAQRRDFFRVQYLKDIRFKKLYTDTSEEYKTACLADISGSGLRMFMSEKLEIKNILLSEVKFGTDVVEVKSEVVWTKDKNSELKYPYEIGCRFLDLSESIRDKIVRFIFDEERKTRKDK